MAPGVAREHGQLAPASEGVRRQLFADFEVAFLSRKAASLRACLSPIVLPSANIDRSEGAQPRAFAAAVCNPRVFVFAFA